MSFMVFLKNFLGFQKKVGHGIEVGAVLVSQHPEIVTAVAGLAGHPEVGAIVNTGVGAAVAVGSQIEAAKAAK